VFVKVGNGAMCRGWGSRYSDIRCFGEFGSVVWGGVFVWLVCGWLCPWIPPSVEAALALTEPRCAGRSMPPVGVGRRVWT
jgi:hypothetical protein